MTPLYSLPFREQETPKSRNRRVLLIINPVSGRTKSKTSLYGILDKLYSVGTPAPAEWVTVVPTTHRGHAAELAASAHREGFDAVICCGGDGTLNETVRGILSLPPEERPELGYIPAGSTNDFAASLGLPSLPSRSAEVAMTAPAHPLDIGLFTPDGEYGRHFTYIASFGVFTAASYTTPQTAKNVMGHAAYIMEGVKDLMALQPRRARFELSDGTVLEDSEYVFCAVTNTTSAGGVIQLPKAEVSFSDGLLELLLIKLPKTPADLNRIVTALLTVNPGDCPLIEFRHTESVRITTAEPTTWSLDGEEAPCGRSVTVNCLPSAVKLRCFREGDI